MLSTGVKSGITNVFLTFTLPIRCFKADIFTGGVVRSVEVSALLIFGKLFLSFFGKGKPFLSLCPHKKGD